MTTALRLVQLLAVLVLSGVASAQSPDYANLVSLWRLSGNTADNYGPNNGSFVGTASYVAGPRPDTQAASLNGASYIKFGQAIAFDTSTPFSATAWIKGAIQDSAILGRMRQGGAYTGWELHVGTDLNPNGPGRLNVWLIESFGPSYLQVNSAVPVLDEAWHQIAFTYDGSGVAAGVRIYVDGVDATGDASADSLGGSFLADDVELALGTRQNGAAHNLRGDLAEVAVWNVALTAENIAHIFANGVRPPVLISIFAGSAPAVFAGTPATLTWEVEPGTTVTIDQGVGDVTAQTTNGKGSVAVTRELETTYTLTATKGGRSETKQVTVGILPLITEFKVDRTRALQGQPIQFSWVVHPEAAVSLLPMPGNVSASTVQGVGAVQVTPTQGAVYVLTAQRGATSLSAPIEVQVIATQPPDFAQLVSLWRLQNNTTDGYGPNNGVFVGTAAYDDGPRPGQRAAVLDGGSFIKTGQGVAFDQTMPFSATAWIKGPLAQDSTILGRMRQGGGYTGWELHVGAPAGGSSAGRLNVWLINAFGPSYVQVNSPLIVLDNTWHHVAFTYVGSSTAAGVKIYVDGVDATGEATADSLADTILADDAEFDLGTRQNGANHNFKGSLREVSVWNVALTPQNLAHLYLYGVNPPVLISGFFAEPSSVFAGTATTLNWEVEPGTTLTIDQGVGDVTAATTNGKGSRQVSPETETTYTLRVTRGGASLEASVEVFVVDAPPAAAPDLAALAHLWRLNGDTLDAKGGSDGTFLPAAVYGSGPDLGKQAAVFNGGSHVAAGTGVAFETTDSFTVTAWLKGPTGQDSTIVGRMRQGGGYTGWELHVGSAEAGLLNVWMITAFGSAHIDVRSPVVVLDDTWHHVAFSYDGSATASGVRIYVDGLDATGDIVADALGGTILPPEVELNLGSRQNGANHSLRGSLADVAIWNIALSPANVADVYLNGIRYQPPVAIQLAGAQFEPPASFKFSWNSVLGAKYRVERSTDLRTWTVAADDYPAGGATATTSTFQDTAVAAGARFYRVGAKP